MPIDLMGEDVIVSQPVYIVGHRNPDTDSIAAALGYAELKRLLGENAIAARAGQPNPETRFALDAFGIEAPVLLDDLRPRIRDVMQEPAATAEPEMIFYEAARIMQENALKALPVREATGRLVGIISLADLAERYLQAPGLSGLSTAVGNVAVAVEGRVVGGENGRLLSGKVVTAAMDQETLASAVSPGDIVILGGRPEAQMTALQAGAACLVLTGGAPAVREVVRLAESFAAAVIVTGLDPVTALRRLEMSIPVGDVMRTEVVTFGPDDLVEDARQVAARTKHRQYPVVDENGRLIGVVSPSEMSKTSAKKVILVDHNSPEEAVKGIESAEVLEIIDHHRLAGLQTASPLYVRMEPVGSSSTLVAGMFLERGLEPSPAVAGMLLSAILSDTLLFKSPTCTPRDREMAEFLSRIAGVDWQEHGLAMLRAGSSLRDKPVEELVTLDYKVFRLEGHRIGVGQINTLDLEETLQRKDEFLSAMEERRAAEGLDAVVLMVTDPIQEGSEILYVTAAPQLVEAAFSRSETAGSVFVPGLVSRKKQMIPLLTKALATVAGAA